MPSTGRPTKAEVKRSLTEDCGCHTASWRRSVLGEGTWTGNRAEALPPL